MDGQLRTSLTYVLTADNPQEKVFTLISGITWLLHRHWLTTHTASPLNGCLDQLQVQRQLSNTGMYVASVLVDYCKTKGRSEFSYINVPAYIPRSSSLFGTHDTVQSSVTLTAFWYGAYTTPTLYTPLIIHLAKQNASNSAAYITTWPWDLQYTRRVGIFRQCIAVLGICNSCSNTCS